MDSAGMNLLYAVGGDLRRASSSCTSWSRRSPIERPSRSSGGPGVPRTEPEALAS